VSGPAFSDHDRTVLPSLEVQAVWDDPDMVEVCVTVANGGFSGRTHVYIGLSELGELAAQLDGYPREWSERVTVLWGSSEDAAHQGLVRLEFRCRDRVGHPYVTADLVSSDMGRDAAGQAVKVLVPFEASALDRFVAQLRVVGQQRRGRARLGQAAEQRVAADERDLL
jgi:hypothetical protein